MGQLAKFDHEGLTSWIHEQLDAKKKDCGMGWIHAHLMEGPPKSDVHSVPPTIKFMRMVLWFGAGRRAACSMAACPHHAPH